MPPLLDHMSARKSFQALLPKPPPQFYQFPFEYQNYVFFFCEETADDIKARQLQKGPQQRTKIQPGP
jgi:hypothetical protein